MRLRLLFLAVFVFTGCEEVVDRPIQRGDQLLVVDGVLTNELKQHHVRLSWSVATPNDAPDPVSGAIVEIYDGYTSVFLQEDPLKKGDYITPNLRAVFGQTYTLHIKYNGKEYFAQDNSTPVEPMNPLSYRAVSGGYVINFEQSGSNPNYIRHEISWKGTTACNTGACEGLVVFYDLKTIDVNEGTKPTKEDFVFPAGATVVRRKYSLSQAYKTYLRGLLSETEWRGGPFDVDRANAPTNLSRGATGFFAVCTVVADGQVVK